MGSLGDVFLAKLETLRESQTAIQVRAVREPVRTCDAVASSTQLPGSLPIIRVKEKSP